MMQASQMESRMLMMSWNGVSKAFLCSLTMGMMETKVPDVRRSRLTLEVSGHRNPVVELNVEMFQGSCVEEEDARDMVVEED